MNSSLNSLKDSYIFIDQLLATTREGYWLIDNDAVSIDVNPAMCKILDRTREEIIGEKIFSFIDTASLQTVQEQYRRRQAGEAGAFEVTFERPDGTTVTCINNATPIFDDAHQVIGALGQLSDITSLKESQRLYRDLIEGSAQGILIHRNMKPLLVNQRYAEMFGFKSPDEIMALESIDSLVHPRELPKLRHISAARMSGKDEMSEYEYEGVRKDGTPIWLHNSVRSITWQGETAVQATVIDVTARIDSDRTLHDLYAAIEAMAEPVVVMDDADRFIFFNKAYRVHNQRMGKDAVIGERFEDHVRGAVKIGAFPDAVGREEEWIQARMARHRSPVGPFEFSTKTNDHLAIVEQRLQSGGSVLLINDITALKNQQLDIAKARDEAEQASRAKSEFLSSMSHELRTPLNSILGFSQLLADDPKDPISEAHRRYVDRVMTNGEHLLELINQILDLSRIEAGQVQINAETVHISDMVTECLQLAQPLADERGISLTHGENHVESTPIYVDRNVLRQILLNLISNAIKYNLADGTVTVYGSQSANGFVRISVTDTGPGISAANQTKLFEPFNRLGLIGNTSDGVGIGLTISKKLTEKMDGKIGFQSEEGSGSTFWVQFPGVRDLRQLRQNLID